MPNIFAAHQQSQRPGGSWLAPRITFGANVAPPLNPTQSYQVAVGAARYNDDPWWMQAGKYVAAAPADVADSFAAIFGNERGAVNDAFWDGIGQPGMASWVRENQGGVEIASGLMGAVVVGVAAEMAAVRVASSAWFAATGVGRAAQPVVTMVSRAQEAAKAATLAAAQEGNAIRWTSDAMKVAVGPLRVGPVGAQVLQNMGKAAVSEAAIAAALNKNTFIWSDDMADNLLWGALGIAIPGAAGAIFGRAGVYKYANSPEVRLAASEAVDPAAFQRGAQALGDVDKARQIKRADVQVLGVSPSYILTQLAIDASLDNTAAAAKRAIPVGAKRGAVQTETSFRVRELAQQISHKGIDVVPDSGFNIVDGRGNFTSAGKHVAEALEEDPTLFLGLRSMGTTPIPDAIEARAAYRTRVNKKAAAYSKEELEYLERIRNETPVYIVGKKILPAAEGEVFARHTPNTNVITKMIHGVQELTWKSGVTGKTYGVREDGRLIRGKWEALNIQDVLAARDAMRENMQQLLRRRVAVTPPKDANFVEIDYAIEYESRSGQVDWSKIGVADADEARLKSLQLKAQAITGKTVLTSEDRIRYNLPLATSVERVADPDGTAMLRVIDSSKKATNLQEVKRIRAEIANRFELVNDISFENRMDGDLFNFGFGREGQLLQPITAFYANVPAAKWSRFDAQMGVVEGKTVQMSQLLKGRSKFVSAVTEGLISFPGLKQVADVTGLLSSQIGGTRNAITSIASSALTQAQRFRNNPTLVAAQQYRRHLNRIMQGQIDESLARMSPLVEQITSVGSAKSKIMFDTYFSLVPGWDIRGGPQIQSNGLLGFVLDHESVHNQRRYLDRFGKPLTKGILLTNPRTGLPVYVDKLANDMRIAWEAEAEALRISQNTVRRARGQKEIEKRKNYAAPKSTRGKYVAFTLDARNRVVEGGAIVADTLAEFNSQAAKIRKQLRTGERLLRSEEIQRFTDLWDQADLDFVDPTSMAAPGRQQTGSLASEFIDSTSIERALTYIKSGYENLGNGITRTILGEQLKLAEVHSRATQIHAPQPKGTKNIHEIYMETLLGMPSRMNPTGAVKLLDHIDDLMDAAIESWWPGGSVTKEHMRSMLTTAGFDYEKFFAGKKKPTFAELSQEMSSHMPFKDVTDYYEYVVKGEAPWKSRELARKVNQFGTAAILRYAEIPHAAMNMAGIITNMPGLVGARNVPLVGKTNGVGIIDTVKIMANGFKRMMREGENGALRQRYTPDVAHMILHGDMSQQAAEFDIAFGQLKPGNHSAWNKAFFGDKSAKKGSIRELGVDGLLSVITDTSESMSRKWAHFVGLELADYHGITGLEARHVFARQVANDAIANYDVWNRPEVYQNALGSMYGLFLSYAQQYYQRIWSFMEAGDYRAVGRTLAIQSSLFGFAGLPGFRQVAALFGGEEDGDGLIDGIYERFGPHVGSIVAQGGFNQLTTLLGLPAVSLHTRGDVNFRHPALDFATEGIFRLPAGLEVIKDLATGVTESVAAMAGPGGGRKAAEVMARHMPSRIMSGAISVLGAGGDEVDAYGNVMTETNSVAESVFRFLGLRSARQQGEVEAYYMNQQAQAIEAAKMDVVRSSTRAAVRAGNFDQLPRIFEDYLEAGGQPTNYAAWIRDIIKEASTSRAQNQLLRSMRNPAHQDLAHRIEIMTAAYQ